jgi:hypothetical protein
MLEPPGQTSHQLHLNALILIYVMLPGVKAAFDTDTA